MDYASLLFGIGATFSGVILLFKTKRRFTRRTTKHKVPPKTVVVHHFFGRDKLSPSKSPFPVKLETFLRMTKTPYMNDHSGLMSSKGKTPWIELDGVAVSDSQFSIEYIKKTLGADANGHLTEEDKGIARAFQRLIEENLYWAICIELVEGDVEILKKNAPFRGVLFHLYHWFIRRFIRKATWGHGIGRHSVDEVWTIGRGDLEAISAFLGGKHYLMGDHPSEIDCSLFGMLMLIMEYMPGSRYQTHLKGKLANLDSYYYRMKEQFWSDWDTLITSSPSYHDDDGKLYFHKQE